MKILNRMVIVSAAFLFGATEISALSRTHRDITYGQ
jgi:hypothetical protein